MRNQTKEEFKEAMRQGKEMERAAEETIEKPKRKRRTKAEIEAEKAVMSIEIKESTPEEDALGVGIGLLLREAESLKKQGNKLIENAAIYEKYAQTLTALRESKR